VKNRSTATKEKVVAHERVVQNSSSRHAINSLQYRIGLRYTSNVIQLSNYSTLYSNIICCVFYFLRVSENVWVWVRGSRLISEATCLSRPNRPIVGVTGLAAPKTIISVLRLKKCWFYLIVIEWSIFSGLTPRYPVRTLHIWKVPWSGSTRHPNLNWTGNGD